VSAFSAVGLFIELGAVRGLSVTRRMGVMNVEWRVARWFLVSG
jgi:hypothetical protein